MATQGIFFAGRTIKRPGAYAFGQKGSQVSITIGALNIVMIVGTSEGGQPNTPLLFSVADEDAALATVRGGNLYAALQAVWHPSPDDNVPGADAVICVRVNPATQSTATFNDTQVTPAVAFTATSRDWGKHTVDTQVGVLAGVSDPTLRKVTVKKLSDGVNQTSGDLGQILGIAYSGNGTASITVAPVAGVPTLTITVAGATDGSSGFAADLTAAATNTIAKLAAFIQGQAFFNCKIYDAPQMPSQQLDALATTALTATQTVLRAINGAIVNWINNVSVAATATFGENTAPAAVTGPIFLTGGTDGTPTNTLWTNAFRLLGTEPGYFLTLCTGDPAIHALALQHIQQQSDITVKHRRVGYFGHEIGDVVFHPDGTVDISAVQQRIFNLNSQRVVFGTPGVEVVYKGDVTLYPSWLLAIMMAGIKAGSNPQVALTNKTIEVQGLEGLFDPTVQDQLIDAAATYAIKDPDLGYKIGLGQTAQLLSSDGLDAEPSEVHVADTILTNMERSLGKRYTGVPVTTDITVRLNQIRKDAAKILQEAADLGMLVGGQDETGATVPPFRKLKVSFSNRTYAVSFEASIAEPGNYITILATWSAVTGVAA